MDVISISSGSEEDSDVEIVSVYNTTKEGPKEFARKWTSFPSPYIGIPDSGWEPEPLKREKQRRENGSLLVAVALSDNSLSEGEVEPLASAQERATPEAALRTLCHSPAKSPRKRVRTPDFLRDFLWENWECSLHNPPPEQKEEQKPPDGLESKQWSSSLESPCLSPSQSLLKGEEIPGSPLSCSPESAWIPQIPKDEQDAAGSLRSVTVSPSPSDEIPASYLFVPQQGYKTDNALEDIEAKASPVSTESERDIELEHLGGSFPEYPNATPAQSPFSPYYCPSDVDSRLYADSPSMKDGADLSSAPPTPPTPSQCLIGGQMQEDLPCGDSPPDELLPEIAFASSPGPPPPTPSPGPPPLSPGVDPSPLQLSPTQQPGVRSVSPTSTEILNGDSPDWLGDDAELTNDSSGEMDSNTLWSSPGAESPADGSRAGDCEGEELSETEAESEMEAGSGSREASREDRQYVSKTQLNRLKRLMGRPLQEPGGDGNPRYAVDDDEEEEEEKSGPMCRLGLSLVHSSMEEHCHDSTLQLLADFLHPRCYPPPDVVSHLIRGILLNPECSRSLAVQAYSLLVRIQTNHRATASTVQWDWQLLTAAMNERGAERRPVVCLFLQYILQTLQEDFYLGLPRLQDSIAKATLSCYRAMTQVRDVISWLVAAVMGSAGDPRGGGAETEAQKKEKNENLKVLMILQKMLALAVEVDCCPTINSNKICEHLLQRFLSTELHREHRLLLLETLESRLLQCKLVELMLQHICADKTEVPMSLSLILHFLRCATLPPDSTDGEERWRRWRELLQLLWILFLSYDEVTESHLRVPIVQRAKCSHAPIWTANDDITQTELQEAADCFLSRVSADLGHTAPPQVQELFSCLQNNLRSFCRH